MGISDEAWGNKYKMASFFFRKQKSDIVKPANDLLQKLRQTPTLSKVYSSFHTFVNRSLIEFQQEDELAKYLSQMKMMLQGTQGTPVNSEALDTAKAPHQMLKAAQSRFLLLSTP